MKPLPHRTDVDTSRLAQNADRLFLEFMADPTPLNRLEALMAHEDFAKTIRVEDVEAAFAVAERLRELE